MAFFSQNADLMSGFQPSNSEMDEDNHSDAIAAREVTNVNVPNKPIRSKINLICLMTN